MSPAARRVWLVTVGEPLIGPLEDRAPMRTAQIATHMRDAGWEVTWWTSGFDHQRKRHFSQNEKLACAARGIEMRWLDGIAYGRNLSVARWMNHVQLAAAFSRESAHLPAPDVIAVSLPPIELAAAASRFAVRRRTPFVVDVRDLWPDIFIWATPRLLRPLVRVATFPMWLAARRALRAADAVFGVSEGYLSWALSLAGRARARWDDVIPIFGPPARATASDDTTSLPQAIDVHRTLFVFAGTFGRSYDLATVVEAARRLPDPVARRLQIVLAGDGERRADLESRAAGLPHVVLTGWLRQDQLSVLLSHASVGMAAYAPGALQSIPNKIVDYLSFGLPILNALEGECASLLRRSDAGWSYRPGDASGLANLLEHLTTNMDAIGSAAAAARRLFSSEFDPARSKERYVQRLATLAATRSAGHR